jgi:hypothetical protein
MGTFLYRIIGAMMLDAGTYEAVEADHHANGQALAVVLLSSLAAGVGASGIYGPRPATLLVVTGIALVTWVAWAMLTLQIGTRILPGPRTEVDMGQMLRTIGFAASPGLLQIAAIFAPVGWVFGVTAVWMLAAMVVAVRHALDYSSTGRALAVCAIGWWIAVSLAIVLSIVSSPSVS